MSEEVSPDDPSGDAVDGESPEVPEGFVEQVAAHDEALAEVAATLIERSSTLEEELDEAQATIDELSSRLTRSRADFENYKRRMEAQREDIKARATERLVKRLVDIRTDMSRALETEGQSVDDLREGVRMILHDLDRILDAENVEEIDPDPGEQVDPHRHEVMMRVESDQPAGEIVDVFEPGYEQAGRVLNAAKVTISAEDDTHTEE